MALNDALEDRRIILPKKFNFIQELTIHGEQDQDRPTDSVIVHYANRSKPWTEAFSTRLYQNYYGSSPWKGFSKELVYKKDPNSIRRYALWHLKNKDFNRFTKLLLIYLTVLIERKKRKLSKKLAHQAPKSGSLCEKQHSQERPSLYRINFSTHRNFALYLGLDRDGLTNPSSLRF